MRYLNRNPIFNLILLAVDAVLAILPVNDKESEFVTQPRRILLANGAHLGDVVISTSVLPILKRAFPDAEIGFLIGSWANIVLQDNHLINYVHTTDHWKLNRSKKSVFLKLYQYWMTRRNALNEIKGIQYDVAIDLYTCFPNMGLLLWQANIPIRIGYVSSGFGPLYTKRIEFSEANTHEALYQARLLYELPIPKEYFLLQKPVLPLYGDDVEKKLCKLLAVSSLVSLKYCIFHLGAGLPAKEWELSSWRELVHNIIADGYRVLFTGAGYREWENAESILCDSYNSINVCDKLSWAEFLVAIKFADTVFCVDSLAGHLAAALNTRCIVIYSGITDPNRWAPLGTSCELVKNNVQCAPCHQRRGCRKMQCMKEISSETVYTAWQRLHESSKG